MILPSFIWMLAIMIYNRALLFFKWIINDYQKFIFSKINKIIIIYLLSFYILFDIFLCNFVILKSLKINKKYFILFIKIK